MLIVCLSENVEKVQKAFAYFINVVLIVNSIQVDIFYMQESPSLQFSTLLRLLHVTLFVIEIVYPLRKFPADRENINIYFYF